MNSKRPGPGSLWHVKLPAACPLRGLLSGGRPGRTSGASTSERGVLYWKCPDTVGERPGGGLSTAAKCGMKDGKLDGGPRRLSGGLQGRRFPKTPRRTILGAGCTSNVRTFCNSCTKIRVSKFSKLRPLFLVIDGFRHGGELVISKTRAAGSRERVGCPKGCNFENSENDGNPTSFNVCRVSWATPGRDATLKTLQLVGAQSISKFSKRGLGPKL